MIEQTQRDSFASELNRVFAENGLSSLLDKRKTTCLTDFAFRLCEENEKYNLTALTSPEDIILRHFADCAALVEHIPESVSVLDVGCGAGFPSLVVAILRPDLSVTAMDSTEKKVKFVSDTASLLSLSNVKTIVGRAEDLAKVGSPMRESFDVVTARAVARLQILAELCIPFVKVDGLFLAMKGPVAQKEAEEAAKAIPALSAKNEQIYTRPLHDGKKEPLAHAVIVIRKKKTTQPIYPRSYSAISKKPL